MSTLTGGAAGFRRVPAFLSYGFRPFFFAAGLWSALALLLWIAVFVTGSTLPSRFDPLAWHIHEMLCGFVMVAIAGFVLTAIHRTGMGSVDHRGRGRLSPILTFWLARSRGTLH